MRQMHATKDAVVIVVVPSRWVFNGVVGILVFVHEGTGHGQKFSLEGIGREFRSENSNFDLMLASEIPQFSSGCRRCRAK